MSFDMKLPSVDASYLLGDTSAEHQRLIRQAAIFEPFTERLFRDAGVGPGQRVLDIGSGVGDVAMLAARLTGPTGEVVGVERDATTLAMARSRVGDEPDIARWVYDLFCTLLPQMREEDLPNDMFGDLDPLQSRLGGEPAAAKGFGACVGLVGAWSLKCG